MDKFLQVDKKGRNTSIKNFLDMLQKLGVECALYVESKELNEVTFTVRTRKRSKDLQNLRTAMKKCFGESK